MKLFNLQKRVIKYTPKVTGSAPRSK